MILNDSCWMMILNESCCLNYHGNFEPRSRWWLPRQRCSELLQELCWLQRDSRRMRIHQCLSRKWRRLRVCFEWKGRLLIGWPWVSPPFLFFSLCSPLKNRAGYYFIVRTWAKITFTFDRSTACSFTQSRNKGYYHTLPKNNLFLLSSRAKSVLYSFTPFIFSFFLLTLQIWGLLFFYSRVQ